jgi:hypothetical protein
VPVGAQVSEVKEIMMQNIEKVLDRGEKLELLVDKTENLRYQADQFQKSGKALRNKMWWQARGARCAGRRCAGFECVESFVVLGALCAHTYTHVQCVFRAARRTSR